MSIEYNNKTYRDDRLFVLNLSTCNVSDTYGGLTTYNKRQGWVLYTIENTLAFNHLISRYKNFDTIEEAMLHAKKIEPKIPLISNSGQPLNIPDNISSDEDKWNYYNDWLIKNDLFSCLEGYPDKLKQHCSYNIDKKGYNYHQVVNRVTNFINGVEELLYDNGKIQSQITWHNGQRHGLAKTYFENDKLDRKAFYVNDNMHGHYERYHENGQLRSIGQLVNDEQSGHWEWFDEKGHLIETKDF